MRSYASWIGLLLTAALPACGNGAPAAWVTLELEHPADAPREEGRPGLESGHHVIRVRNALRLPADCPSVGGTLAAAAGELTLRVGPEPGQGDCVAPEISQPYLATISGLRPGRYNLRVVHTRIRAMSHVVLEHPVVVIGAPSSTTID